MLTRGSLGRLGALRELCSASALLALEKIYQVLVDDREQSSARSMLYVWIPTRFQILPGMMVQVNKYAGKK